MDIKEILEEISLPARSNKRGFKETEKLDKIAEILEREKSPFHLIKKSDHAWIFGQNPVEFGKETVLVSSHADIVSDITKPFSEYNEETKYMKGTYDNMGTNGACVEMMLNRQMPENVYFAFTAEEESGRFTGAEYSLAYMRNKSGSYPGVIVLDVTYEGYDHDRLCTVEGLHAPSEEERVGLLNRLMETEGSEQSFEVVRMKKKDDNSFLPESYQAKETTECDESYYYAKQNCLSFSLDLPTDGSMHSNSGLRTKEAVLYGYCDCLASAVYTMSKSFPDKIEELKAAKDAAVLNAKETEFYKYGRNYTAGSFWGGNYPSYNSDYIPYRPVFGKRQDPEIPGQMSLSDYMDIPEDLDKTKSIEERCDEDDEFNEWYSQLMCDAYESATLYPQEDIGQYLEDIAAMAGIDEIPEELEEKLVDIWTEAWNDYEAEGFYYDEDV